MSIEAVTPKQDAAAAAPIATPMPTTTPAVAKVDVAQYTPGGASSATPSDFRELGDVLLGEDMSMMGGDAWTASSASSSSSSSSAKPPSLARSATSFLPPQHHHHNVNSTPRHAPPTPQAHQAPPQFFACPPAQLTRHASLPVTMMRPHAINMPVHHAMPFVIAAPPPHMMAAMPPSLHRQRSQGFVMHAAPPPHAFHPMQGPHRIVYHPMPVQIHHPQMPQPNAINVSVSPSPQQQQHKIENASSKSDSVEPIAFNGASDARMSLGEIDSIALAMFADPKDKKTKDNNDNSDNNDNDDDKIVFKASTASSIGCGQDLERALDSLDKFLPEADTDLFRASDFRPSDLADMVAPVPPSMRPSISSMLVTPRNVQSSTSAPVSGRAALPLLMSPQHSMKTIASPAMQHMHMHQHPHMHLHSSVSTPLHTPRASPKPMATCKVGGCDRRVRSKGFCKTHGGGRKCNIEGCKKSSQNGEFCIGHGGGKKCKHDGCAKAAQSHGLCKAHGGGARCKYPNCNKSSQGGGLCRAHGGGKRCQAAGCPKGAQRGNFCATHGGFRNCHIEGCVRTDRGGGFCEVHRRGRLCKIDGCKKLSRNQGMCTMHIREDKQEEELQQLQQGVAVQ